MVKTNVKSLIIILLVCTFVLSFTVISLAASASEDPLTGMIYENALLGGSNTTNNPTNGDLLQNLVNEPVNNVVNNTPVYNVPVVNKLPTNVINGAGNSTLPKTGENDIYIVTTLIVVFAIVTIYAYKKIRDYSTL